MREPSSDKSLPAQSTALLEDQLVDVAKQTKDYQQAATGTEQEEEDLAAPPLLKPEIAIDATLRLKEPDVSEREPSTTAAKDKQVV